MRKYILFILLMFSFEAFAVIAKPGSGVYGDEYFHYRKNEDGSVSSVFQSSNSDRNHVPHLESTFPLKGKVRSVVLLVNFTDSKFITPNPQQAFTDMLNQEGYSQNSGTGSAKDYFLQNSYQVFDPTFDVFGPYELPNSRSYYKSNAAMMVVEACDLAEKAGVDFKPYDENGDQTVDNIFIYYAGHNPAEGGPDEAIWPHRGWVYTPRDDKLITIYTLDKANLQLWDYACTSELQGSVGSRMCGIGTFCHEFSHVLGLDDLYNTSNSDVYTVGTWDIMCSGNYNNSGRTPPSYSAFERWMLGWLQPEQLTENSDFLLEPIETTNHAYLIADTTHNMSAIEPNPKEYWLIENRQRVGWDKPAYCLPGVGLIISHIQFDKNKWDNNKPNNTLPLLYDICEAYYKEPYYSAESDTYPGIYDIRTFLPTAQNGKKLTNNELREIHTTGNNCVAFHHGPDDGSGLRTTLTLGSTMYSEVVNGVATEMQPITIQVNGYALRDSVIFFRPSHKIFEISLDNEHWTTDTLFDHTTTDSTYHGELYVRYHAKKSCITQNGLIRIGCLNEIQTTQAIVDGESRRPILIHEVECVHPQTITPYSIKAEWKEQDDAEEYYLTFYSASEGPFRIFKTPQHQMAEHGETYLTETYPLPVQSLTMKINNFYSMDNSTEGEVVVEGYSQGEWKTIETITIRGISSSTLRTLSLDTDAFYQQFRFTYRMRKGEGKINIYSLEAIMSQTPEYIYKDTEYELGPHSTEALITSLSPSTTYYYYLVCKENKGCEPHTTLPGSIMRVNTLPGNSNSKQFTIGSLDDGNKIAYLPTPAVVGHSLQVFSAAGQLLLEIPIETGVSTIVIPTKDLHTGQLYFVKYAEKGKMKRKDIWAKFIL